MTDIESFASALEAYIHTHCGEMLREGAGVLRYPYIVPSAPDSPYYSATLWDWDSWLTTMVFGQVEADLGKPGIFAAHEWGTVLNYLELASENGEIPICVTADGPAEFEKENGGAAPSNMHKPVLAQQAAFLAQRDGGDVSRLEPYFDRLETFLTCYLTRHTEPETGLAYWQTDMAVGVDNDPSVFYRPDRSCGSVYLNCLLYRELLAFGYLCEQRGDMVKANLWRGKAADLRDAVNRWCWDERDGTYYSVDFALRPVDPDHWLHSGAPRDYPCLLLRVDSWSSFLPLWAGIADREQAERMLCRFRDERTFACRAGIRTLSRLEKPYDLRATNNPSNWRGPVWGVSNYLLFSGLLRYGFEEDALTLADKTIRLLGRDLEVNGCLHEYYHPDTCEPIVTHGFQNWNFLVLNMIAWKKGRRFIDTF